MKGNRWNILLLCAALTLAGCSSQGGSSEPVETTAGTSAVVTTQEPETTVPAPSVEDINPLTGESGFEGQGKRAISFMVSNIKQALPSYGLDTADICYEVPVEGGITRVMAVYADYDKVERVGSMRSARHYFLELAYPHDTIFMHFGRSIYALDVINERSLDTIDGTRYTSGYYQDKQRLKERGQEHSFFATKDLLPSAFEMAKERVTGDTPMAFSFAREGELPTGEAATSITVKFSNYNTAGFDYDAASGEYKKSQFGAAQQDENTGTGISVQNVFVLFTKTSLIPGQSKGLIEVDLSEGEGYYASGGKIQPIRWAKNGFENAIVYTDASGQELNVTPGQSWICITDQDNRTSFQYQ